MWQPASSLAYISGHQQHNAACAGIHRCRTGLADQPPASFTYGGCSAQGNCSAFYLSLAILGSIKVSGAQHEALGRLPTRRCSADCATVLLCHQQGRASANLPRNLIMTGPGAKLGILLPVASRGSRTAETVVDAIEANILSALQPQQSCEVIIGVDYDDSRLLLVRDSLQQRCQQHGVTATLIVFHEDQLQPARQLAAQQLLDDSIPLHGSTCDEALAEWQRDAPAAPICWMWWQLALQAAAAGCSCIVLLGDDTTVEPAGTWVDQVLGDMTTKLLADTCVCNM